jgi:hypothetical protein
MKIPRQIIIKGEKWKIRRKTGLKHEKKVVWGLCDYDTRVIWLERNLSPDQLMQTWLHEFNHACIMELHVELEDDLNEVLSDGLAYIYATTFKMELK